jgi:hypothetical protein
MDTHVIFSVDVFKWSLGEIKNSRVIWIDIWWSNAPALTFVQIHHLVTQSHAEDKKCGLSSSSGSLFPIEDWLEGRLFATKRNPQPVT